jgi:hypothetical protein
MAARPRLFIKEMVLRNFKSYAGEQRIGPFHKVPIPRFDVLSFFNSRNSFEAAVDYIPARPVWRSFAYPPSILTCLLSH